MSRLPAFPQGALVAAGRGQTRDVRQPKVAGGRRQRLVVFDGRQCRACSRLLRTNLLTAWHLPFAICPCQNKPPTIPNNHCEIVAIIALGTGRPQAYPELVGTFDERHANARQFSNSVLGVFFLHTHSMVGGFFEPRWKMNQPCPVGDCPMLPNDSLNENTMTLVKGNSGFWKIGFLALP